MPPDVATAERRFIRDYFAKREIEHAPIVAFTGGPLYLPPQDRKKIRSSVWRRNAACATLANGVGWRAGFLLLGGIGMLWAAARLL